MKNIAIKTDVLKKVLKTYDKVVPIKLTVKNTTISLNNENKDLLQFLSENAPLTNTQKSKICGYLADDKLQDVLVGSISDLYNKLSFINLAKEPVLEAKINNKWYPISVIIEKIKTYTGSTLLRVATTGLIGSLSYGESEYLGEWTFEDKGANPIKRTIKDVLQQIELRFTTPQAIAHTKKMTNKVIEYDTLSNRVFDATGAGLVYNDYWGWSDINIAYKNSPIAVVVESILENKYHREDYLMDGWRLPFVRVFSLKHKEYVYLDVEDLQEHTFDQSGKEKIVLPTKIKGALESIFNASKEDIFGDLFSGRHGGIVVLANGPPGSGKTLSAEVFAEYQERPLYSMEMAEIGTNLADVEANLQKIFARAKKWNAVLLFDEADIFLSERAASELERSAIVGVFLRLLDYYEGTFFLTTNRGEGIDKAFKSRVTLYLNYPELSTETKGIIWESMLKAAHLNVKCDVPMQQIAEENLNGRQIRNQVRLLRLMYPDNQVKTSQILESLEFAAK